MNDGPDRFRVIQINPECKLFGLIQGFDLLPLQITEIFFKRRKGIRRHIAISNAIDPVFALDKIGR